MGLLARYLGAAALLAVGVDHLEQRSAAHYSAIPTIGTLFLVNFVSATVVAAGSVAGLLISETGGLFGFTAPRLSRLRRWPAHGGRVPERHRPVARVRGGDDPPAWHVLRALAERGQVTEAQPRVGALGFAPQRGERLFLRDAVTLRLVG